MDQESELQSLTRFISKFAAYEEQLTNDRLSAETIAYTQLFGQYVPVDKQLTTILAHTAPYYNIFSVLNVRHYETKLHTPFLAHLLDPHESHQQSRLFFDSFLSSCIEFRDTSKIRNIQVFEEYPCSYGRLDILINYKIDNVNKAIVIENKIYHHDEDDQLQRYYEYLTNERKLRKGNYHIIYLKPNMTLPSITSMSAELTSQLQDEGSLVCLGYHQDIVPWLSSLVTEIKPNNLQHIIGQYISTIKTL